ncbi:MAG: mobile mystery protein B [Gemmatimonadaceae bacterium]
MRRDALADTHEGDGDTPLDEAEVEGLMPSHLETRADLNQWEAKNLELAMEWLSGRSLDVLELDTLQELHRRMFGQTWTWAGSFRRSEKNISPYRWPDVPRRVRDLLANTATQYEAIARDDDALDKLAARFHHELVRIHPWPNGNGRHGRLATDLLLERWKRPPFTWGAASGGADHPATRSRYIEALRRADTGEFTQLHEFVRT